MVYFLFGEIFFSFETRRVCELYFSRASFNRELNYTFIV